MSKKRRGVVGISSSFPKEKWGPAVAREAVNLGKKAANSLVFTRRIKFNGCPH